MTKNNQSTVMKRLPLIMLFTFPFLAGCAQLPDWAQPLRLIDAAVRGDDLDNDKNDQPPGIDDPFPDLANVPERPKPTLTIKEQKRMQQELEADRQRAIKTDRALRERTS